MKKNDKNGYPSDYKKKLDALRKKTFSTCGTLSVSVGVSREPTPSEAKDSLTYRRIRPGEVWAKRVYDCGWFHVTGALPADYTEKKYVIRLHIGGEGLVYANDGAPYEMISAKMAFVDALSAEEGKTTVRLSNALVKDGRIDFYMDAGFNAAVSLAPFGVGVFRYARLARVDDAFYTFYYDYLTVLSLYATLKNGDGAGILAALEKVYDTAIAGERRGGGAGGRFCLAKRV